MQDFASDMTIAGLCTELNGATIHNVALVQSSRWQSTATCWVCSFKVTTDTSNHIKVSALIKSERIVTELHKLP